MPLAKYNGKRLSSADGGCTTYKSWPVGIDQGPLFQELISGLKRVYYENRLAKDTQVYTVTFKESSLTPSRYKSINRETNHIPWPI